MKLKRIIAIMICVVMCAVGNIPGFAANEEKTTDFDDALSYTCVYDNKNNQILVEGTVNHDTMIKYRDYEIRLYSIAPGMSYDQLISDPERQPIVSTAMTIRFSFRINVLGSIDRFSRYIIVLRSPDGDEYPADRPMIPNVSSDFSYTYETREGFKGIHTPITSDVTSSGAGTVIVDINIEDVLGDTSDSILHFMNGKYFYMRRSYVAETDTKVRSASISGSRVYLRFLLDATRVDIAVCQDAEAYGSYSIPDLYKGDVLDVISAVSGFFAERYSGSKGSFYGIILGESIDDVEKINNIGDLSCEQYADMYALYLAVVANTVRITHPHVDIVIPFSGINDYSSDAGANKQVRPSILLENIVSINDSNFAGEFKCSVMVSADTVPFNISNDSLNGEIDMSSPGTIGLLGPDNIAAFVAYIDSLSKKYDTAPDNLIYLWSVPDDLDGSAMCLAYIYSYYRLYSYGKVSSFIASFNSEGNNYKSISKVFKYIDTDRAKDFVDPFSAYFGKDTWKEVMGMPITAKSTHKLIETTMDLSVDASVGEFRYIDFSDSGNYDTMLAGEYCEYLQIAQDSFGNRALVARSSTLAVGESFEFFSVFEYPESYVYTPRMSLVLSVSSELLPATAAFEVTLTIGNGNNRIQAVGIVGSGDVTELVFDASEFSLELLAERVKISVRSLTGDTGRISVNLYELKGYSEEYFSEELSALVEEQRLAIRTKGPDALNDEAQSPRVVLTLIGIVFAVTAVAAALLIIFRKEDYSQE